MSFEAAVHAKAVRLDSLALNMTAASGSGHPTTALSLGHIVTCLLYEGMRWVPENPGLNTSDRLVLSEGHAVPIVYAAFADLGVMIGKPGEERPCTVEDLDHFRESDSPLDGHPNPMVWHQSKAVGRLEEQEGLGDFWVDAQQDAWGD